MTWLEYRELNAQAYLDRKDRDQWANTAVTIFLSLVFVFICLMIETYLWWTK